MSHLLDTNVVSALRRLSRAPLSVQAWAGSFIATQSYLSAITLYELERGTVLAERSDPGFGRILRTWLEGDIIPAYRARTFPVDAAIARQAAVFAAVRTMQLPDALIAATALVHDLTVVTQDVGGFAGTGVRLLNPWDLA